MTEREWMHQLLEDVRRLFRTEAEPAKQAEAYEALRETMYGVMDAMEDEDFDDGT